MDSPDPIRLIELGMDNSGTERTGSVSKSWIPPGVDELNGMETGFQIRSLIAVGGMGAVYFATDLEGREIALKVMPLEFEEDPILSARFEKESEILRALDHENIVSVFDVGETIDGLRFIAMEYLSGGELKGKPGLERAIDMVGQI